MTNSTVCANLSDSRLWCPFPTFVILAFKVRVVPTDLSNRLKLSGIYMMEAKDGNLSLLDYISMAEVNKWPFRTVRR